MMGLVDVEDMVPTQVGHDFARITVPLYEVSGRWDIFWANSLEESGES